MLDAFDAGCVPPDDGGQDLEAWSKVLALSMWDEMPAIEKIATAALQRMATRSGGSS